MELSDPTFTDFLVPFCYRWFCHFDDDNYVNTARLAELLSGYNPQEDWYLGKNSIRTPLQIMDRAHNGVSTAAGARDTGNIGILT